MLLTQLLENSEGKTSPASQLLGTSEPSKSALLSDEAYSFKEALDEETQIDSPNIKNQTADDQPLVHSKTIPDTVSKTLSSDLDSLSSERDQMNLDPETLDQALPDELVRGHFGDLSLIVKDTLGKAVEAPSNPLGNDASLQTSASVEAVLKGANLSGAKSVLPTLDSLDETQVIESVVKALDEVIDADNGLVPSAPIKAETMIPAGAQAAAISSVVKEALTNEAAVEAIPKDVQELHSASQSAEKLLVDIPVNAQGLPAEVSDEYSISAPLTVQSEFIKQGSNPQRLALDTRNASELSVGSEINEIDWDVESVAARTAFEGGLFGRGLSDKTVSADPKELATSASLSSDSPTNISGSALLGDRLNPVAVDKGESELTSEEQVTEFKPQVLSQASVTINSDFKGGAESKGNLVFEDGSELPIESVAGRSHDLMKNSESLLTKELAERVSSEPSASSSLKASVTESVAQSLNTVTNNATLARQAVSTQTIASFDTNIRVVVGQPEWAAGVAEKVASMASKNLSFAEIQLDPPELGPLQVRVSVSQDQAQAAIQFTSHSAVVRDALDQSAFRLREMFGEEGLDLMNVDVSDQPMAGESQRDPNAQHGSQSQTTDNIEEENTPNSIAIRQSVSLVDHFV